jgi:hypothetical protein
MEMQHPLDLITLDEQVQDMVAYFKEKYSHYRMYILVRESIPLGKAINSVAHGAIGANDLWQHMDEYQRWKAISYRKITCKVSDRELELIYNLMKKHDIPYLEQTENSLNGEHTLTVVFPIDRRRTEKDLKPFNYLRLYK